MRYPILSACGLLIALAVFVTWPQALHLATHVPDHDDSLFSIWRLAWVAHALRSGEHLFDANIFYPHTRTLALSDATFFEALLAAPWLWLGVNKILVYNVLLLGGIVTSGLGMFVLVRYLTGNLAAAAIAAAIFTVTPYRIEHVMHLELQWTVWMPLTIWALHRTFDEGTRRWGALTGLFLWLQLISCVYYGAYLAMIVAPLAIMLGVARPEQARRAIVPLVIGAALAAALTLPYALPYIANTVALGPRPAGDVSLFSANWISYATTPHENWLWGWSGDSTTGNELHLFPGIIPPALAVLGMLRRPRRLAWMYVVLLVLAVMLSFGINAPPYRWLYEHVAAFRGFRAPARFAILAWCAMSVLAGFGAQWLLAATVTPAGRRTMVAIVLAAVCIEAGSAPLLLAEQSTRIPPIYQFLRQAPRSVILELPHLDYEPTYMYWSTVHWQPMVNGYSGYKPLDVMETMEMADNLPDGGSIARLRELNVHYILIHQALYQQLDYTRLMEKLARHPELTAGGVYRDWLGGNTQIFELHDRPVAPR